MSIQLLIHVAESPSLAIRAFNPLVWWLVGPYVYISSVYKRQIKMSLSVRAMGGEEAHAGQFFVLQANQQVVLRHRELLVSELATSIPALL